MKIPWTHKISPEKSRGRLKVGQIVTWTTPWFKTKAEILGFKEGEKHLVLVRDEAGEWFANVRDLE